MAAALQPESEKRPRTTRLHCHAVRPGARVGGSERCSSFLGDVLGPVEFVGVSTQAPRAPDGHVWLRCQQRECRLWNCFRVAEGRETS